MQAHQRQSQSFMAQETNETLRQGEGKWPPAPPHSTTSRAVSGIILLCSLSLAVLACRLGCRHIDGFSINEIFVNGKHNGLLALDAMWVFNVWKERFAQVQDHSIMLFGQCTQSRFVLLLVVPVSLPPGVQFAKRGAGWRCHNGNKGGRQEKAGEVVDCAQNVPHALVGQIHWNVHVLALAINVGHSNM